MLLKKRISNTTLCALGLKEPGTFFTLFKIKFYTYKNVYRLEWESSVLRGVNTFQQLEEERLNNLKLVLTSYLRHVTELQPRIMEVMERNYLKTIKFIFIASGN